MSFSVKLGRILDRLEEKLVSFSHGYKGRSLHFFKFYYFYVKELI